MRWHPPASLHLHLGLPLQRPDGSACEVLTLQASWRSRYQFVVFETALSSGHSFLDVWKAWCNDEHRCTTLFYVAIVTPGLSQADLQQLHGQEACRDPQVQDLINAWPLNTPNVHRLSFQGGRVQLLLARGEVGAWLPEWVMTVDAFLLSPTRQGPPVWDARLCKALGRLAAPGARLMAVEPEPGLAAALITAGFSIDVPQPHINAAVLRARFAPRFQPRPGVARCSASRVQSPQRVVIVGAGLAGCATACALAEVGWHSVVLDRGAGLASEGSGNPAGLFHGIVNAQDGVHARFNRAAALATQYAVQTAVRDHGVLGSAQGLLRLEHALPLERMRGVLQALNLPAGYVEALKAEQASALSGLNLSTPAWHYPGGGWAQPVGLARAFMERAGARSGLRTSQSVSALRFENDRWCLLDVQGEVIEHATTVVLANAGDALGLLATGLGSGTDWPLDKVRGQISHVPLAEGADAWSPRLPIAGTGYVLPVLERQLIFGSTAQVGDDDSSVRWSDHQENLARLARLIGQEPHWDASQFSGRTAWRWSTPDRLPVVGPVPVCTLQKGARMDQVRLVPRVPGLYVCTAFGSRGMTWAALAGQVVAAAISGAPAPLEACLLDAIDPARFMVRRARRAVRTSVHDLCHF